ncbi:alpha-hydroxy-acid oxidizing protein [Ensifer sp. ENS06]|uniref:alpha-hydroxy-acid oxidizing protein n=1 Tax=Ensifer TaxID=106591 RepID=UPI0009F988F2
MGGSPKGTATTSPPASFKALQGAIENSESIDHAGDDRCDRVDLGNDIRDDPFVGRPFLYAAVVAGSPAIRKAIDILKSEIHQDMALLGVVAIDDIDGCFVVRPDRLA